MGTASGNAAAMLIARGLLGATATKPCWPTCGPSTRRVNGEYGWPRMHKELLARGIRVGKDRVRKLMQQHGIQARTKRKFVVTTDSKHSLPVAPDLVQRRFNPEAPNQLWSGDFVSLACAVIWLD